MAVWLLWEWESIQLPVRELASQCERCSEATSLLRDWVVNRKRDPEPVTTEITSFLTHVWYLPCKCTLQLHQMHSLASFVTWFPPSPAPKSIAHSANHNDGRQDTVKGRLSSSRPPINTELHLLHGCTLLSIPFHQQNSRKWKLWRNQKFRQGDRWSILLLRKPKTTRDQEHPSRHRDLV